GSGPGRGGQIACPVRACGHFVQRVQSTFRSTSSWLRKLARKPASSRRSRLPGDRPHTESLEDRAVPRFPRAFGAAASRAAAAVGFVVVHEPPRHWRVGGSVKGRFARGRVVSRNQPQEVLHTQGQSDQGAVMNRKLSSRSRARRNTQRQARRLAVEA